MLGLDQHEVGAMAVSQLIMRHGFEVVYLGRFNTPAKLAAAAEQEDADVVDRCHAAGAAVVVGGSVLTEADERQLQRLGVDATFGPYAPDDEIVNRLDELVARARAGDIEL